MNLRKFRRIYFGFAAFAFFVSIAGADSSPVYHDPKTETREQLDLEKMIELTLQESEAFKIAENDLQNLQAQYREVRAEVLPQVSASSSWSTNFNYPDTGLVQDYDNSLGVEASQLIWAFGRVRSAIRAAKRAVEANVYSKDSTRQGVVFAAKQAYYTGLLAENTLRISQSSYENVAKNKEILKDRTAKGRVSKRDFIKMDADVAARVPQVTTARAQNVSAFNTIRTLTGIECEHDFELTSRFRAEYDFLNLEMLKSSLLANEPRLQSLEKTIAFNDELIRQQKSGRLPTINGFANYTYSGMDDASVVGSGNMDSVSTAGVKMSVPLFTGWRTTSKIEQAVIARNNAKLEKRKLKEELLLELENAVSDYHEFIATLKANNEAVRLAEEAYNLTQELFSSGLSTLTDLNDSEQQLTGQKLQREQTLYNLNITMANIEQLTGIEVS